MSALLHGYLEAAADKWAANPAVVGEGQMLTYGQLESKANFLARVIRERGVREGGTVAIFLEKSPEAIAAVYATLKAGAAYVPLDPRAPAPRLAYMIRKCATSLILSNSAKSDELSELGSRGVLDELTVVDVGSSLEIDGLNVIEAGWGDAPSERAFGGTESDDPAYILFTSGSTGEPKGVTLSHENGRFFVDWAVRRFSLSPVDRLASHAPLHFDLSIFDIFASAAAGACVVLVPPAVSVFPGQIPQFIRDSDVTIWYSVPSVLTRMVRQLGSALPPCESLRLVLFGGEVFPIPYLDQLMRRWTEASFFNLYGPTESNACTCLLVSEPPGPEASPLPLGHSIPGLDVLIVGEVNQPLGADEEGEICVSGPSVMLGYWDEPEMTNAALVPFPGQPEKRMYPTGDIGRRDSDGKYHLVGRRDDQIKSRGYRIELAEVESLLYRCPDVAAAAVVAVPDQEITNRLVAFVVRIEQSSSSDVWNYCSRNMPGFMIPDAIEYLPSFPMTSTGKVDRRFLRARAEESLSRFRRQAGYEQTH